MHNNLLYYIKELKEKYPNAFNTSKVLEAGSLDINGSVRELFVCKEYMGVDWIDGKGVDVISIFHEFNSCSKGYFQTVISTEMLEHDPYWIKSIKKMLDLLAFGGFLIITYAGPTRKSHRLAWSPEKNYYKSPPLTEVIDLIMSNSRFRINIMTQMELNKNHGDDIYLFFGDRER